MNRVNKLAGIVVCGMISTMPVLAQDKLSGGSGQAATARDKIAEYINGNLFGIQNIKKDADKRIISLVSIGRAPISTAVTKARAKNQAFKKADANARAEFMKWLTTAVTYTRIDQEDVAIIQKGESLGDQGEGNAKESSDVSEMSHEMIVSVASGFVKGMVQIGSGINDDGEAVVILGWNADTAEKTDEVRNANVPRSQTKKTSQGTNSSAGGAVKSPNKANSVSDAASEFL